MSHKAVRKETKKILWDVNFAATTFSVKFNPHSAA